MNSRHSLSSSRRASFASAIAITHSLYSISSSLGVSFRKASSMCADWVGYAKLRGTSGFWRSVWGMPEDAELPPVTRFEWSVRCYKANMPGLRYLSEYTFEGFLGLLNYVSRRWGSLRVPEADTQHKSRWPLHPLWAELQGYIAHYSDHYQDMVRPQYHLSPDIKPEYLQSMAGWLAGLQARLGVEREQGGPATLAQVLGYLHEQGHSVEDIARKADAKWEVLARLSGRL